MKEYVVLVSEKGRILGKEEKIKAHEKGLLHKAFSIVIFNSKGEMLLQQRALKKYHFPGIWSNACCSHPRFGEKIEKAAHRKLKQELGFDAKLTRKFSFIYKVKDKKSGLWEHELDAVFVGKHDGKIKINKREVKAVKWVSLRKLEKSVKEKPEKYSYWFRVALRKLKKKKLLEPKGRMNSKKKDFKARHSE